MNDGIEIVVNCVYLGDKLNAGGGCLSAVTARVRVGWMKFRELNGVLCGRIWNLGFITNEQTTTPDFGEDVV